MHNYWDEAYQISKFPYQSQWLLKGKKHLIDNTRNHGSIKIVRLIMAKFYFLISRDILVNGQIWILKIFSIDVFPTKISFHIRSNPHLRFTVSTILCPIRVVLLSPRLLNGFHRTSIIVPWNKYGILKQKYKVVLWVMDQITGALPLGTLCFALTSHSAYHRGWAYRTNSTGWASVRIWKWPMSLYYSPKSQVYLDREVKWCPRWPGLGWNGSRLHQQRL